MARTKAFNQEQALEKALHLFWCKGYEATSMQDLVEAMGVNRQSLYDTFGDKHALYLAALDHYGYEHGEWLTLLLEQSGSAREILRRLFDHTIAEAVARNRQGCFIVNSAVELAIHDAEIARRVEASRAHLEQTLRQIVERGQAAREINARHRPESLARFLRNNILGLQVMIKADDDPDALRDVVNTILATLA